MRRSHIFLLPIRTWIIHPVVDCCRLTAAHSPMLMVLMALENWNRVFRLKRVEIWNSRLIGWSGTAISSKEGTGAVECVYTPGHTSNPICVFNCENLRPSSPVIMSWVGLPVLYRHRMEIWRLIWPALCAIARA